MKAIAVVVTCNRQAKLLACLNALDSQTVPCDVLVIDNGSTDGTEAAISNVRLSGSRRLTRLNPGANLGGAGGFAFGMRKAVEMGADRIWAMDDDVLPNPDALEQLMAADAALKGDYGWLSSACFGTDGKLCPMNRQRVTPFRKAGVDAIAPVAPSGERSASSGVGGTPACVKVQMASFASLFFPAETVRLFGLPIAEFFIWCDDLEWTRRVSLKRSCHVVPSSIVIHDLDGATASDLATDVPERIERYFYAFRNELFTYRREGLRGLAYYSAKCVKHFLRVLLFAHSRRHDRLSALLRGIWSGLGFNPQSLRVCLNVFSLENRGDWLMFEAMLQAVRNRLPNVRVGVPLQQYRRDRAYYDSCGVAPVRFPHGCRERLKFLVRKTLAAVTLGRQPLTAGQIDLLLFCPGFRYSDQFDFCGPAYYDNEIEFLDRFASGRTRIVFMPQALGPFEVDWRRRQMEALLSRADHIYAREATSFRHAAPLISDGSRISIAPDFTCQRAPEDCPLPFPRGGYVAVVPNQRMVERTHGDIPVRYREFMVSALRKLLDHGEKVVLLNFESSADVELLEYLSAAIENRATVIQDVSCGKCKAIVAGAKLVIASRYHAMISALAEGRPTLFTSWSHKYREFAAEMNCVNSGLSLADLETDLAKVEDALANPEKYRVHKDDLARLHRQVDAMWDEILGPYASGGPSA